MAWPSTKPISRRSSSSPLTTQKAGSTVTPTGWAPVSIRMSASERRVTIPQATLRSTSSTSRRGWNGSASVARSPTSLATASTLCSMSSTTSRRASSCRSPSWTTCTSLASATAGSLSTSSTRNARPGSDVIPETHYAKTADGVHVPYQVAGEGPVDLVFVMGWATNIEAMWDEPNFARLLRRLAGFSRLILFDKRGLGLSDRVPDDRLPSLETRMDDVRAVMDAAASERAVVFGVSEGGPMSILFAATYPARTVALVLYGTVADFTARHQDYKVDPAAYDDWTERAWGAIEFARAEIAAWGAPGYEGDEHLVPWLASYRRKAASPGAAIALDRMNREINASHALSSIHVPTLVIARTGD